MRKIPDCLSKLIGIDSECNEVFPRFDDWLLDMPGISLEMVSQISSKEHLNGRNLMRRSIDFATKKVMDELNMMISSYVTLNKTVDTISTGLWGKFMDVPIVGVFEYGARIGFGGYGWGQYRHWRDHDYDQLQRIHISSVDFLARNIPANHEVSIHIIDGGVETVQLITPINDVVSTAIFDYTALTNEVIIFTRNTEGLILNEGSQNFRHCFNCHGSSSSGTWSEKTGLRIEGWENVSQRRMSNNIYGIKPNVSIKCDPEPIYCMLSEYLSPIIQYETALHLLKHQIFNTTRINDMTRDFSLERAKENIESMYYDLKQKKKNFGETVQNLLYNIKDDHCINCKGYKIQRLAV